MSDEAVRPQTSGDESDPMLDEIRAIKRRISGEHGDDVRRLAETLREIEARHANRVVRSHPAAPKVQAG